LHRVCVGAEQASTVSLHAVFANVVNKTRFESSHRAVTPSNLNLRIRAASGFEVCFPNIQRSEVGPLQCVRCEQPTPRG
jgi:hypothetical protein